MALKLPEGIESTALKFKSVEGSKKPDEENVEMAEKKSEEEEKDEPQSFNLMLLQNPMAFSWGPREYNPTMYRMLEKQIQCYTVREDGYKRDITAPWADQQ